MFSAGMVTSSISKFNDVNSFIYFQYDELQFNIQDKKHIDIFCSWFMEKISLVFSENIIATTDSLKQTLIDRGFKKNLYVIPNQVNQDIFYPIAKKRARKMLDIDNNSKIILFAGRLEYQKNIPTLMRALGDENDIDLFLLGDGSMKNKLTHYSEKLNVNLNLKGRVDHKELALYYNAADIFVLPSFYEGSPKSLIEAMACGSAIIASNILEHQFLMKNNYEGLLFDPFNFLELKISIRKLLADSKLRNKLSDNVLVKSKKFGINEIEKLENKIFRIENQES